VKWYVIHTKPHQERLAQFYVNQLSIETFLPLLKLRNVRQQKAITEPLFPRYIFAKFDIAAQYRAVNFARGVLNIVEFGSKPAEVDEELIQALRERLDEGCIIQPAHCFRKGELVQIKTGPLAGLEAVFVKEIPEQQRVLLLLKMLGLQAKLTMGIEQGNLSQVL
jgi:transcriptional antiterminator RfaH